MSRDAATHTPFPNFGKVEYFCGEGLTGVAGCFGRRAKIAVAERRRSDGARWAQRDPGQFSRAIRSTPIDRSTTARAHDAGNRRLGWVSQGL